MILANRVSAHAKEIADFDAKRFSQTAESFKRWCRFTCLDTSDCTSLATSSLCQLRLGQASKLAVMLHLRPNLFFQTRHSLRPTRAEECSNSASPTDRA